MELRWVKKPTVREQSSVQHSSVMGACWGPLAGVGAIHRLTNQNPPPTMPFRCQAHGSVRCGQNPVAGDSRLSPPPSFGCGAVLHTLSPGPAGSSSPTVLCPAGSRTPLTKGPLPLVCNNPCLGSVCCVWWGHWPPTRLSNTKRPPLWGGQHRLSLCPGLASDIIRMRERERESLSGSLCIMEPAWSHWPNTHPRRQTVCHNHTGECEPSEIPIEPPHCQGAAAAEREREPTIPESSA